MISKIVEKIMNNSEISNYDKMLAVEDIKRMSAWHEYGIQACYNAQGDSLSQCFWFNGSFLGGDFWHEIDLKISYNDNTIKV